MSEDLRVDTGLVSKAGSDLQTIASAIPQPPGVSRPSGADALSTAIAAKITEVVDPVVAQLPVVKQALQQYAQKVETAAKIYDNVDRMISEEIQRRVEEFDEKFGTGSSGASGHASNGSSGAGGGGPRTGAPAAGTPTAARSPAGAEGIGVSTAAASQSGQAGQMMQVPLQMAQQAAQVPTQMMGMAGAAPQAISQGMQTVTQRNSGMSGADDGSVTGDEAAQAAAGSGSGERAPATPQQLSPADDAEVAPSGPAGSSPEIAL
jgi:hypothetical protein